jgi:arylsulfatase A-like enzyme
VRQHRGRPWFLSINLFDPHPPFDPPADYLARFDRAEMPAPLFAESDLEHQRRLYDVDQQARVAVDPRRGDPDSPLYAPPEPRPAGANHDTPPESYDGRLVRAAYHAMIALIDAMVGELMAVLDETGQRRDTLVVFMSDHGEMLGDHGLIYKGSRFYEGLVHVPMILSQPGRVREGVVSEALVELVDLAPTLLEAAGMPPGEGMQGKSLWPLLTGAVPAGVHKPYVLCEYFDALGLPEPRHTRASMYFDGRWKLCVYHTHGTGELYDLAEDPSEFNDLWEDPAHLALRSELTARAFDALMLVSEPGPRRTGSY